LVFTQGNYSVNALIGLSALRLLNDCFLGVHPEYNKPQQIQNKWIDIQTRIRNMEGYSQYRNRKRLINDKNAFLVWFDKRY